MLKKILVGAGILECYFFGSLYLGYFHILNVFKSKGFFCPDTSWKPQNSTCLDKVAQNNVAEMLITVGVVGSLGGALLAGFVASATSRRVTRSLGLVLMLISLGGMIISTRTSYWGLYVQQISMGVAGRLMFWANLRDLPKLFPEKQVLIRMLLNAGFSMSPTLWWAMYEINRWKPNDVKIWHFCALWTLVLVALMSIGALYNRAAAEQGNIEKLKNRYSEDVSKNTDQETMPITDDLPIEEQTPSLSASFSEKSIYGLTLWASCTLVGALCILNNLWGFIDEKLPDTKDSKASFFTVAGLLVIGNIIPSWLFGTSMEYTQKRLSGGKRSAIRLHMAVISCMTISCGLLGKLLPVSVWHLQYVTMLLVLWTLALTFGVTIVTLGSLFEPSHFTKLLGIVFIVLGTIAMTPGFIYSRTAVRVTTMLSVTSFLGVVSLIAPAFLMTE